MIATPLPEAGNEATVFLQKAKKIKCLRKIAGQRGVSLPAYLDLISDQILDMLLHSFEDEDTEPSAVLSHVADWDRAHEMTKEELISVITELYDELPPFDVHRIVEVDLYEHSHEELVNTYVNLLSHARQHPQFALD